MAGCSTSKAEILYSSDSDIEIIDIIEVKPKIKVKREIKKEAEDSHKDTGSKAKACDFAIRVDMDCNMNPQLKTIVDMAEEKEMFMETEGDDVYFECDVCLMKFTSEFTLRTHVNVLHYGKNDYKCDVCDLELATSRDYINHRNSHVKRNVSASDSLKEWLVSYDKEYECSICFMKFEDVNVLASHKLTHLPQPGYKCKICSLRLKTRHYHTLHVQAHLKNDSYKCDKCGSVFLYKTHLLRHQVVHSSKRYFQCDTCLYIFKNKADIEKHVQTHMKK